MSPQTDYITVPATEIRQSKGKKIYSFVIDGKKIHSFASISRLKRGSDTKLSGYPRPEVLTHIDEIRSYLESPSPMIPNGIVLALDSSVKFTPAPASDLDTKHSRLGTLRIPTPRSATDSKPGFIVDGQQRVAAIRDAQIKHFPVVVTAFITKDIAEQTEQFILINSTKPLNRGLIYELLPYTEAKLPATLHKKRLAATLLELLNHRPESPFFQMIQTPTTPSGVIKDNSILRMLEQSLTDGALFRIRRENPDGTARAMTDHLDAFWWAVRDVFAEPWSLPPRRSRLTHGVGIISIGNLMDHIAVPADERRPLRSFFRDHLTLIAPKCAWTGGSWELRQGQRAWNEIQNTRQDVALIADHLQSLYDRVARRR